MQTRNLIKDIVKSPLGALILILCGILFVWDAHAYSRGICSSRGSGGVNFHVHAGYTHHGNQADELFFLLMLSSTSTTIYCLTFSEDIDEWNRRRDRDRRRYSSINYQYIRTESAQGKGEHLAALATLYGCPEQSNPEFAKALQLNYKTLYTRSGDVDTGSFLNDIKGIIQDTPKLEASCSP